MITQNICEGDWREQNPRQHSVSANYRYYVKQFLFFLFCWKEQSSVINSFLAVGLVPKTFCSFNNVNLEITESRTALS